MTPERWHQIGSLFERALDLPAPERSAFLHAEYPGDPSLIAEVLDLLQADDHPHPDLDEVHSPFLNSQALPVEADEQLGPYRLLRPLGEGGMGTVYLAHREDVDRYAAIKFVRPGVLSTRSLDRFRHERRILARLTHPNIAQFLDTGLTRRGVPYVVMEYVEGQPLDGYCEARRLSIAGRLRLFQQAGQAVQHAHQSFVVHRDLKPSNIFVTEDEKGTPSVKLLDFGIAKLIDEQEEQEGLTQTGLRVMTPEYAAPEQVKGETITAATDVYALGVVLYELLTGQRPYELRGKSGYEAEQIILHREPEKPSTAVSRQTGTGTHGLSTEQWRRRLEGDLDVICLKALRKTPGRRYASAEAFVEDIKRYLAGLPVTAQPDTLGYRAKKFVRRHWGAVATGVLIVLLVVGYATTALVQARHIEVQAAEIALERDKAEEVSAFLMGLFEASNPNEALGDTLTALELLERGRRQVALLSDQPAVQLRMLEVIADVYIELARFEEADSLLDEAMRLLIASTPSALAEASLNHRRAAVLREKGELQAADSVITAVVATRRALRSPDLAASLSEHGNIARRLEAYDEAEASFLEALTLYQQQDDIPHVATALSSLGNLYQDQYRYQEAEPYLREALALRRQHLGAHHPQTALSMHSLATTLRSLSQFEQAEVLYREALASLQTSYGPHHPRVAAAMNNLAGVLREQQAYDEARPYYETVIEILNRLHGMQHPSTLTAMNNLAVLLFEQGTDFAAADSVYLRIFEEAAQLLPSDHLFLSSLKSNRAYVQRKLQNWEAAYELHQEVLEARRAKLGPDNPLVLNSQFDVGYALFRNGHLALAEEHVRAFIEGVDSTMTDIEKQHVLAHQTLAQIKLAQGALDEAEPLAQVALIETEDFFEPDHYWIAYGQGIVGAILCARGRLDEADALFDAHEATIRENVAAEDPLLTAIDACR